MAAPPDRVRVFKLESPATGGTDDDEGFQALANPNQDAISVQGIYLQKPKVGLPIEEDELVYVSRNVAGDMIFRDVTTGTEYTLTQLAAAATAAAKLIDVSFASNDGTLGLSVSNDVYEIKGNLLWPGSSYIGTPISAKITGILAKAGTGYFKIYDLTNSLQVAEGTTTTVGWAIIDLGSLSNIASGEAMWEFQMKSVGSPKNPEFIVGSLMVKFS